MTAGAAVQVGVLLGVMAMGLIVGRDSMQWLFSGVFFPIGI